MATQTLEFGYTTNQTLTAQVFAIGSDTVVATADSVTEATNRKGRYLAEFTDLAIGSYLMVYFLDGTAAGSEVYRLIGTGTATIHPESETVFKQRFDTNEAYLAGIFDVTDGITLDLSESGIRDALGLDEANLTNLLALLDTEIGNIENLSQSDIRDALGLEAADLDTKLNAIGGNVDTLITQLATAYGEPADAPGVSETMAEKIGYLYSALRNKIDVTASAKTFYDDSGNALWSKSLSDDNVTYSEEKGS